MTTRMIIAWSLKPNGKLWHAREVGSRTAVCGATADVWPTIATKGGPDTQPPLATRCAPCKRFLGLAS